jgi:hypothetical protein
MALDEKQRRSSLVFPVLLIAAGTLFLYVQWHPSFDPWPIVTTYWPLILIFVGLGMMWDYTSQRQHPQNARRFSLGSTLGVLAFVLVLAVLLWHGHNVSSGFSGTMLHNVHTIDLQGAKSVSADLEIGAGHLVLRGGASHLLDASFDYFPREGTPQIDYNVSGQSGQLNISQSHSGSNTGNIRNDWNLRFASGVPLELKINIGAGSGDLNLRDLNVTDLSINIGAGRANVDLTGDRTTDLQASIEGGVGEAYVRLPRKVGVIVNASGGIGTIDAGGLKHDGDEYTNDAYGKTKPTIHLTVEGGVGRIVLTQD